MEHHGPTAETCAFVHCSDVRVDVLAHLTPCSDAVHVQRPNFARRSAKLKVFGVRCEMFRMSGFMPSYTRSYGPEHICGRFRCSKLCFVAVTRVRNERFSAAF